MLPNTTAIERAFQLAQRGIYCEVHEIKEQLRREGYFTDTVAGPILCAQLKSQSTAARSARWKGNSRTTAGTPRPRRPVGEPFSEPRL
jgi:hypothetical protein